MVLKDIVKTTCPRDCYDTCGIEVLRHNGEVVSVRGAKDHNVSRGKLCSKCQLFYNGALLDKKERLTSPLRRVGKKGSGSFEQVSWEVAISEIADRLKKIIEDEGADHILHAHYTGTCSLIATNFPMRFFNRLGAREVEPDTVCNMAGHVALNYMYGTSLHGFDPRTAKDSKCIIVWGANPSASAPHAHSQWLPEAPCPVIVIDPVRHPTAEAADMHLQLFPGTDAALAFSILHVLVRENYTDEKFLNAYTLGWEELKPQIESSTPEWGAAKTGVPEEDIVRAARLYGSGPSLLWLGQGLQRQPLGGNIIRACATLPAACGNFNKPGAGFLYLNGSGQKGVDGDYLRAANLARSPHSLSQMDMAAYLERSENASAFFCWNINPVASSPEQGRLMKALERNDLFTVVIDLFATDTADYADYVLPAASFLEFDDLVSGYFNLSFSAQTKVMEAVGDSLPNQEIFRRLAVSMDLNDPELLETDTEIIDSVLKGVGIDDGFKFLSTKGTIFPKLEPQLQFYDYRFPTPSGKIEIASPSAEVDGHPRVPQALADDRPEKERFRLITPASEWLMNDSYANDSKIKKQLGVPSIVINPFDAQDQGFRENSIVCVSNDTGSIDLTVRISDAVPRGVAVSTKGHWPRNNSLSRANVNVLNPGQKSDMGESSAVHGVEVKLSLISAN